MTKLESFEKTEKAVERSRRLGQQSVLIVEQGCRTVDRSRDLMKEINNALSDVEGPTSEV